MRRFLRQRLGQSLVFGLLVISAMGASTANVRAEIIVGTSTVQTSSVPTTVLDVNLINGNSSLGNLFLNDVATNAAGGSGSTRVVGSNLLSTYGFQLGGGTSTLFNGLPLVAVFALDGSFAAGTPSVLNVTGGRLGIFTTTTSYNQFAPLTWGATNAAGTSLLTPVAVWDIKPQEAVTDLGPGKPSGGGPGIFNLTPGQTNQVSVNTTVGTSNQGFLLFRENGTFVTLAGTNLVNVTGNAPMPPPGFILLDEGLVSRLDESYASSPIVSFISGGPGTAGFDALNTIAALLGGLSDLDTTISGNQAFANAFGGLGNSGGDGRSFNPSNGSPTANTADLFFTLGTTSSPGIQGNRPVPEPASLLLLGTGLAGLAAIAWRRRHRG